MILVVDANSIIAALIKDSKAREIITSGKFTLISPDYIRDELDKHKNYIAKKAKISVTELDLLIILLSKRIRTIQLSVLIMTTKFNLKHLRQVIYQNY